MEWNTQLIDVQNKIWPNFAVVYIGYRQKLL